MSDEKNLSDDLNDMLGDAKEGAKKAADKAGEFAEEAKEKAKETFEDVKESASEFADGAKETFDNVVGGDNKKVLAGILGIFLGIIGVHKFVLGYNKEGIILLVMAVLGIFTCGITSGISWSVGVIEGIIYLTKSDEEFYNTYQVGQKPWF